MEKSSAKPAIIPNNFLENKVFYSTKLIAFWIYLILFDAAIIITISQKNINSITQYLITFVMLMNIVLLVIKLIYIVVIKYSQNKFYYSYIKYVVFLQINLFHFLAYHMWDEDKYFSATVTLFISSSGLLCNLCFILIFRFEYDLKEIIALIITLACISMPLAYLGYLLHDNSSDLVVKLVVNEGVKMVHYLTLILLFFNFSKIRNLKSLEIDNILNSKIISFLNDNLVHGFLCIKSENNNPKNTRLIMEKNLLEFFNGETSFTRKFKYYDYNQTNQDLSQSQTIKRRPNRTATQQPSKQLQPIQEVNEKEIYDMKHVSKKNNDSMHLDERDRNKSIFVNNFILANDKQIEPNLDNSRMGFGISTNQPYQIAEQAIMGLGKSELYSITDFDLKPLDNHECSGIEMGFLNSDNSPIHYSDLVLKIINNKLVADVEIGPLHIVRHDLIIKIKFNKIEIEGNNYNLILIKDVVPYSKPTCYRGRTFQSENSKEINKTFDNQTNITPNFPNINNVMNGERKKDSIHSQMAKFLTESNEKTQRMKKSELSSSTKLEPYVPALLHDFKNAVYDLLNNVDMLKKHLPDELKTKHEDEMNNLMVLDEYIRFLIKTISEYNTKFEFLTNSSTEEIDIVNIINLIKRIFDKRIEKDNNDFKENIKEIEIKVKLPQDEDHIRIGFYNKGLIMSLLYNIVSNSYKYTQKGEIVFEMKKEGNNYVLSIQDTGGGIPADILKNWGKPFNHSDNKGTGLGQFIIEKLAKNLNLKIPNPQTIKNENDLLGTSYKIYFPLEAMESVTQSMQKSITTVRKTFDLSQLYFESKIINSNLENEIEHKQVTILALDDSNQNLSSLEKVIKEIFDKENISFQIYKALDFHKFLQHLNDRLNEKNVFDFIVCDHNICHFGMTGLDCASIAMDIYKRASVKLENVSVFFRTEEMNYYERFKYNCIIRSDRIFSKYETQKMAKCMVDIVKNRHLSYI